MAEIQLGVVEARYADIIWEHEPVSSSELVKLTEEAFHWKRTTAHNVLRRLCDKGLFRNDNGTVTSLPQCQVVNSKKDKHYQRKQSFIVLVLFLFMFSALHCSKRRTIIYSMEVRNGLYDIERGR